MKISDVKIADYNPRKMSADTVDALRASISTFDDISGITINSSTGNIIAGNHRWTELTRTYGKKNLELNNIKGEYFSLDHIKDGFIGFIVRVVDWDFKKEKAANVAANSGLISGDFTSGLQDVLKDIDGLFDEDIFELLRFDELQIDLDGIDDSFDWDDDSLDKVQREAEQRNNELEDSKNPEAEDVKDIRSSISISVPSEMKEEVKDDLLDFLSGKAYYGEITIV